jgi:hypothetical protein
MKLPPSKPKKTTADVPPDAASEFAKAPRSSAIADATGTGYTTTKKMQQGQQSKGQFGLPPSPGKGPGVRLKITVHPDTDMDEPVRGGSYKDMDKDKK